MTVTVNPVTPRQWPLARALTGKALHPDLPGLYGWLAFFADADGNTRLVGAVVLRVVDHEAVVWVAVAEPYRRLGVGRALAATAIGHAQRLGVVGVSAWQGLADTVAWAFCESQGFQRINTLDYFETTLADAEQFFAGYYQRFVQRGTIPDNLSLSCDGEVPWSLFQPLMEQEFGIAMAARLAGIASHGLAAHEWAVSLSLDGVAVAVAMGTVADGCASADAYTVAPAFRRGWAHIVFKYLVTKVKRERFPGDTRYCFSAADNHGDTRKLASLMAKRGLCIRGIKTERLYQCKLGKNDEY